MSLRDVVLLPNTSKNDVISRQRSCRTSVVSTGRRTAQHWTRRCPDLSSELVQCRAGMDRIVGE